MNKSRLSDLLKTTEAVFQREFQKIHPLILQEAKLLRQLAQLDEQLEQVRSETHLAASYQVTGSDVVWHSWEGKVRCDLNSELARVRSQKISALTALREAFGRKQAVSQLVQTNLAKTRRKKEARQNEQ